ncbi:hypothetical protein T4D_15824 [Trichinella pseudospiralis]|uniref:Uncharacterized protein n=1 Tax=Trichinella pseudospiralis TaxID=6337 RepID=A0A0V1FD55_TRIPS|nr:hypothetical protein T4D_15824 [Trichinella pseudospiralis]
MYVATYTISNYKMNNGLFTQHSLMVVLYLYLRIKKYSNSNKNENWKLTSAAITTGFKAVTSEDS